MCTAVTYKTKDHYFGRNFDLEFSYNETVTITPRNYPLVFRKAGKMDEATFDRILQQLQGKTQYIYYHLMGEPLTHPELPVFLQMAADNLLLPAAIALMMEK